MAVFQAPRFIQTVATTGTYATNTTVTVTTTTVINSMTALIIAIKNSSSVLVSSITDSISAASYNLAAWNKISGPDVEIWYGLVNQTMPIGTVITITLSGGTNSLNTLVITNFAGLYTPGGLSVDQVNSPGSTGAPTGATTHTQAFANSTTYPTMTCTVVGTAGASGQTFSTTTSGWTVIPATGPSTTIQLGFSYQIQANTGVASNVMNWTSSVSFAYAMASFLPDIRHNSSSVGVGS